METENPARLRKLAVKFDNVSRPDGSALLAHGETVIQAGVYGPIEVRQARELAEKATVEVFYRSKTGHQNCSDRLVEKVVRSTLETVMLVALHPRTCISISLQELHNDGSLLACCINAACLAAVDAAIAMKCQVAAVSAAITHTGIIVLDPNKKQEEEARATCTFSFESRDSKVVSTRTTGRFSAQEFQKCLSACRAAAADIFAFYRDAFRRRYSKCLEAGEDD
uniref:Putative exosomal 3'-5' exoribonuclease complex subunit rrp41 n=1 Tax=Ixodes ricinus TaxID=34613 RepID=A0A0K8R9P1_IXORI